MRTQSAPFLSHTRANRPPRPVRSRSLTLIGPPLCPPRGDASRMPIQKLRRTVAALQVELGLLDDAAPRRTVCDLLDRYVDEHVELGVLKPSTVRVYRRELEALDQALGNVELSSLSRSHAASVLRAYKAHPAWARKLVERLRHALKLGQAWGWVDRDPTVGLPLPKQRRRERIVTDVELVALSAALNRCAHPHTRRAVWTINATGFRVGETVNLRGADLDTGRARVWVRESKTAAGCRWAPVGRVVLEKLVSWRVDAGWLFRTKAGRRLDPTTVRRALARASELAGIERVVPHHLRHTFASRALDEGVPVHVVSSLLGHSCPTVTLRTYAHVIPSSVQRAADAVADSVVGVFR